MSEVHTKVHDKNLLIILITLCILAIVLAVVVIMNIATKEPEDAELEQEIAELYWEDMSEEDYEDAKYQESFYRMHAQVEKLLEQDPVDVDKINDLYNDIINDALSLSKSDYTNEAIYCISSRTEDFVSKGLKREALDALLSIDYSVYTEPDRYRLYTDIIELAEEIGDSAVVEEYTALRATVENAYLEDYAMTEEESGTYYESEEIEEEGWE